MYAKIINQSTKQCAVGVGTNVEFYKSIDMVDIDVEQAYDGQWYVKGYAPAKPQEVDAEEQIAQLKAELATYDYIGIKIAMGVATVEEYADKIAYTQELRAKINELQK